VKQAATRTTMPFRARRPNPVFSEEYQALLSVVIDARRQSRLSQRELAVRLDKTASHVCMIEKGQRRIDTLEFYRIARACGFDPVHLFGRMVERIDTLSAPAGFGEVDGAAKPRLAKRSV